MTERARSERVDAELVTADLVVAKEVVIHDGKGPRISISAFDGMPSITMFNENNRPRAALFLDDNGLGRFHLFDRNEKLRVQIGMGDGPSIILYDRIGELRIKLWVRDGGDESVYDLPLIFVLDKDGKVIRELASFSSDFPSDDDGEEEE